MEMVWRVRTSGPPGAWTTAARIIFVAIEAVSSAESGCDEDVDSASGTFG
jgi:hypothetical protein